MQMIEFHDNAAVARSGKWKIRLLSRAYFTLAPGHRAVLIVEPWGKLIKHWLWCHTYSLHLLFHGLSRPSVTALVAILSMAFCNLSLMAYCDLSLWAYRGLFLCGWFSSHLATVLESCVRSVTALIHRPLLLSNVEFQHQPLCYWADGHPPHLNHTLDLNHKPTQRLSK